MSDVEMIVNANHERVRWAEEYETGGRIATASSKPRNDSVERIATASSKPRNDRRCTVVPFRGGQRSDRPTDWERRKAYRNTALGCAMFTGGASALVGIGLSTGRWLTVAVGLVVAVLFLCCGLWSERLAEEDDA